MEVYLIMAVVCAVIGLMIDNGRGFALGLILGVSRVAAADKLAEACEIMAEGSLSGISGSASMRGGLAAYQATKENTNG